MVKKIVRFSSVATKQSPNIGKRMNKRDSKSVMENNHLSFKRTKTACIMFIKTNKLHSTHMRGEL